MKLTGFYSVCCKAFGALATVVMTGLGAFSAEAAEGDLDLGALELNKTYEVPKSAELHYVTGNYTATNDFEIRVEYNRPTNFLEFYTDADCTTNWPGIDYKPGAMFVSFTIASGQTVYINKFVMDAPFEFTLMDANDSAARLVNVTVPDGSNYSISSDFFVDLSFSDTVSSTGAVIASGDKSVEVAVQNIGGLSLRVDMATTLLKWYEANSLKAGDPITLTIKGLKHNGQPVGEGEIVLNYVGMDKPIMLVSTENLSQAGELPFLSYYLSDNPARLAKMNFSGPVMALDNEKQKMYANLSIGDTETMNCYQQDIPGALENDGKTLVFDFGGTLRTYETMGLNVVSGDDNFKYMNFYVHQVMGADGQYAFVNSNYAVGSYGYQFTFKEVTASITVDYTPARGSVVDQGQDMEIYIIGLEDIMYDGILFKYGDQTLTLAVKDLSIVPDPDDDDAKLIRFKMPNLPGIVEGEDITMCFANVMTADGFDHVDKLSCNYKAGKFVAGINDICGSEGTFDVYGIDGRIVKRGIRDAELKALPKGIYVAGGRKVTVK